MNITWKIYNFCVW